MNGIERPFVIYADFESTLHRTNDEVRIHKHECNSYAYKIVCCYNDKQTQEVILYRGDNAVSHFIDSLLLIANKLVERQNQYKNIENMIITEKQIEDYNKATHCYICENELKNDKVDHCHFTGNYRGAAHQECNVK